MKELRLPKLDIYANSLLKVSVEKIEYAIELLNKARLNNNIIYTAGNGGSLATASHFTSDLCKAANKKRILNRFKSICLNDNDALCSAIINDDGWENLYTEQLKTFFNAGDVLCCFSVHGGTGADAAGAWSQNLMRAIEYVNSNNGVTIGFSGFTGGSFETQCTINILVPANSTPIVEGLHVVLHHYIIDNLMFL